MKILKCICTLKIYISILIQLTHCVANLSFKKETIYHAKGEKKVCVTEIDKTKYDDVMPGQTTSWDDEEFEVPSVTPPCLEGCKIINIDHYLRVNV